MSEEIPADADPGDEEDGLTAEAILVEEEDPPAPAVKPSSMVPAHATLLAISSVIVLFSLVMRAPGEEKVYLPFMSQPVPGTCVSRELFDFECPGCGMTRCFISMGHGQLRRAWQFNPAGMAIYLFVVAQIPWRTVQVWRLRRGLPELWPGRFNWVLWVIAILLIAQWVLDLTFSRAWAS